MSAPSNQKLLEFKYYQYIPLICKIILIPKLSQFQSTLLMRLLTDRLTRSPATTILGIYSRRVIVQNLYPIWKLQLVACLRLRLPQRVTRLASSGLTWKADIMDMNIWRFVRHKINRE